MRRAIAPTRRKLTLECLQVHAAKHVTGECMFENGALTFVLASPAAGSAKRIRMALLKQLELRIKVRVRGDDGALDEDGEEGESEAEGDGPGDAAAPALAYAQKLLKLRPPLDEALRRQHPQATKLRALSRFASEKAAVGEHAAATQALEMVETLIDNAEPRPPAASTQDVAGGGLAASQPGRVDAGVAFKARMVALMPRLKAALLASGKAAQGAKLKMSEAGLLAGKKNFARADALLDEAEALLIAVASSNAADTQPHQAPTAGPADPPGTQGTGAVAWAKLLLRWRDAEAKARAAVNDLGLAILALPEVHSDPRLHHVKRAVALLPGLIPAFGETLSDVLDEGLNAGTNMDIAERAREVVAQYRQQLATAAALGRLEKFAATHVGELQVLQTLDGALADIAESLQ